MLLPPSNEGIIVAIIVGGGGFYIGMQYQANQTPAAFTGASAFAGRTGGSGGATLGTVLSIGSGSFIIQLPNSTSTTATTGTTIILFDNATKLNELESVPFSNLAVGQSVTISGTTNADSSITASVIQIRPASALRGTGASGATAASGQ